MSPSAEASVATAASPLLPSFEDCEELRRWYVDAALPQVGPWGFEAGWIGTLGVVDRRVETFMAVPGARDTVSEAMGASDTGTNIQESGIDEPDVAKTDGHTVYRVRGRDLLVVDVSGPVARRVARHANVSVTLLPGRHGFCNPADPAFDSHLRDTALQLAADFLRRPRPH